MAEKVVKKIEDQLNCLICLGTYTVPKLLQCNHVFCRDCLLGLERINPQGLPCPTCRQVTPIPPSGVAGLQPAFQTNQLLEILDKHKQDILYCQQHQNRELELYCETCEELICFQCTIQQHHTHKYNLIGEVFEKHKQEIMSSLNPAEQQQTLAREALEKLDDRRREITDQQAALQAQIHKSSQQLHEIIDLREKELANKLNYITQKKLSKLASQREQIETTLAQLGSCLDKVKEKLRTGSHGVVLRMKTTLVKQVKDLTTAFKPDNMKMNTTADMRFFHLAACADACREHGLVSSPRTPDPSQWYIISKVTDVATVGKMFTATFIHRGEKSIENFIESLECELVSELTGTRARGNVERRGQSQYKVSYQPTIKGRHQLHIKVMGEHIIRSPRCVAVKKSPDEKLGTPIRTIDLLNKPLGIALNQSGEVVVTSSARNCVSVFSPCCLKLRSFGTKGSGQRQFMDPRGVIVDGEGNILVSDKRIQKFTAKGQFLTAVGTKGSGPLQFDEVWDIAINTSNNKVYVVDSSNHRIQVLNSDLTFSNTFGKRGENKGEFFYPSAIACDSTGNVYVADSANHRIQVFTSMGKFLQMFGSYGKGVGKLNWPRGIALDVQDKVYVSDDNHRISVFTSEGQFVTSFGSSGGKPGEFDNPSGLAVDSNGVVYVCDLNNRRLQLF